MNISNDSLCLNDNSVSAPSKRMVFHAAPNGGWLNDPNGLLFTDGKFQLLAQYRDDHPDFKETGWAQFDSYDLLTWSMAERAFPPAGDQWMYSGSIIGTGATFEAFHTLHVAGLESQVRRVSQADGGWSAAETLGTLGDPMRNRRDPYIFRDGSGWALLLAEPCDWHKWRDEPASRLCLYRSPDRVNWTKAGFIGPWRPSGIMWEVPMLVRSGLADILFISELDRRNDGAACSVRAWAGKLSDTGYEIEAGFPPEGIRVDHGPDFYALMASTEAAWPFADQMFVAWASSWQTGRAMDWPGFLGGPISFPRTLQLEGPEGLRRLKVRPAASLLERFARPYAGQPFAGLGRIAAATGSVVLSFHTPICQATLTFDMNHNFIEVCRRGAPGDWDHHAPVNFSLDSNGEIVLLLDGPLVEFFEISSGTSATLAIGGAMESIMIEASLNGVSVPLDWKVL